MAAHAALMRGGTNAWQPLNFRAAAALREGMDGMGDAGCDSEVQQALEQLLIANRNVSRPPSRLYYRKLKTCGKLAENLSQSNTRHSCYCNTDGFQRTL